MIGRLGRAFFSFRGRLPRGPFWLSALALAFVCLVTGSLLERAFGRSGSLVVLPPFFWAAAALLVRRLHDRGRSAFWLLAAVVPLAGPLWLFVDAFLRKGTPGENA
jgi:uncharacterized membrane protein YhaH (DUF805 family)